MKARPAIAVPRAVGRIAMACRLHDLAMTPSVCRRHTLLALCAAACGGCSTSPAEKANTGPVLWPMPPEQPRYLFEATLRNGASLRDDSSGSRLRRAITGDDDAKASFGKPFAAAAARGLVYVTDTEGRRVFVFDLVRRRTFAFGLRLQGELKKPAGIALDAQSQVYVVDSTARRLVVYDAYGLFLRAIDGTRTWVRPSAVAAWPGGDLVAVVDTGGVESDRHSVHLYAGDGSLQRVIGKRGEQTGEFNLPSDAAVAPDGLLWVLDSGNFRVQAFDRSGRFVKAFGSLGTGLAQFARPRGLAIDRDGLIYVSDAAFCNVQVFRPSGELLLVIGGRAADGRDAPGRYLLPAKLAADETGRLYVVDQYLHKVEVIRRLSDAEGARWVAR